MKNRIFNYHIIIALFIGVLIISSCKKDEPIATCSDGILNGTEIGVDCGGNCPDCSTCTDGVQNGTETGIDCGGDCIACANCDDGVQNGNETGVDCGGDCDECLDLESLLIGLWELTELTLDGRDAFQIFEFESIYYKFEINNQFESFNHRKNGQNNLAKGTYKVDNSNGIITFFIGSLTSNFDVVFNNNNTEFNLVQHEQNSTIAARKIPDNLCKGIDCNTGKCIYGYCDCPKGIEGENCEVIRGPAGGIVIYDKGIKSNGWRYIEVHTKLLNELPISCANLAGNWGSNVYGAGGANTLKMGGLCQKFAGNAAKHALELNINGFDDWYIPTVVELREIFKFQEYFDLYNGLNPYRDIHSSYFQSKDLFYYRFEPNRLELKISDANIGRKFFVIRYY